jgi:hypothetical protein
LKQLKVTTPESLTAATGLIHPDSSRKMLWDVTVSLVIVYSVITITYQLGFALEFTGTLANVDLVVDCIFALDIVITFNTAVIDEDENLVSDRAAICSIYLHGWFPVDLVTTFPIDRVVLALNDGDGNSAVLRSVKLVRAIRLVRLAKIVRIVVKSGFFEKVEDGLGLHPAVLKLVKLVVVMCFFAHLFACVLFAMSKCDESNGVGCWVESYCVGEGAWFDDDSQTMQGGGECLAEMDHGLQYLVALYWSVTTMTSIGYGDISPQASNTTEIVFTILVEVFGTTVFAYVVGNIVSIVAGLNSGMRMKRQNMVVLNSLMTEFRCTFAFRKAVRLQYLFQQQIKSVFDESRLLSELPPDLRIQTVAFIHARLIVPKVPVLCALEAEMRGAFTLLLPRLRPYCFSRGNTLYHPALGTHREMYFLTSGAVTCSVPARSAKVASSCTPSKLLLRRFHDPPSLDRESPRDEVAFAPAVERFEAGDVLGEVPLLIPEDVRFSVSRHFFVKTYVSLNYPPFF